MIPLYTNQIYTHEIRPPPGDVDTIPTRMGYVVRCSSTKAVHTKGKTYLVSGNRQYELEPPSQEQMDELRKLYLDENLSHLRVEYGHICFSMNSGDYTRPIL